MKKIFFTITACLCLLSVWSQKFTENDLQGKWILNIYATQSASLNVETGKVTLDKSAYSFGQERADQLQQTMESYSEMLKTSYVEINGNNFTQLVGDSVKAGIFTIEDKKDYQTLEGKFDDGSTGSIRFTIKDGKLILFFPNQNKTYVYKKS